MAAMTALQYNTDSAPDDPSSSDCGDDDAPGSSGSCRTSPASANPMRAHQSESRTTASMAKPPTGLLLLPESTAAAMGFRQRPAKRYKRPSVRSGTTGGDTAAPAAVGSSSKQTAASPMKRRIFRKDRRQTLEMLTSDDDVNEYVAARPSSYIEPASRRNLQEATPHMKSSYETLYNPEFNHLLDVPDELLSSEVSSSCDSENAEAASRSIKPLETWHLVSGPKVSSPYLDVITGGPKGYQVGRSQDQLTKSQEMSASVSSDKAAVHLDKREDPRKKKADPRQGTSGEILEEFGVHDSIKAADRDENIVRAVKSPRSTSQPLNVTISVSKPSEQNANSSSGNSAAIGFDLKIKLGKAVATQAVNAAAAAEEISKQHFLGTMQAKLPTERMLRPDRPASPRRLTSPETAQLRTKLATNGSSSVVAAGNPSTTSATTAEKPRGRRVLPAVPDSADLEVSDLLRETLTPAATDRPKSAVEMLVAKGRSSSILHTAQGDDANGGQGQQRPPSMVSQQLRSLFHNPSPQIMLHRAATRLPQAAPARPESVEFLHQQQTNRYLPLRGTHHNHRVEDTRGSSGGGATVDWTSSNSSWRLSGPAQGFLRHGDQVEGAERPPELPLRRNRSLLPGQRSQQESQLQPPPPPLPPRPQSAVPPPPTVPPRQARTTIARQKSPSTFYPNRVLLGSGQGSNGFDDEHKSVDHIYKRHVVPASPSFRHTEAVEMLPEPPGDTEYLLAGESHVAPSPQFPSRIQTNPRAGARARDSVTMQADSTNYVHSAPMGLALELSSLASREDDSPLTLVSALTADQGSLVRESQRDELRHRPVSRRDQGGRVQPVVAAKVAETPEHQVGRHTSGLHNQSVNLTISSQTTVRDRLFGDQTRTGSHRQTTSGQAPQLPAATVAVRERSFGDRSESYRQTPNVETQARVTVHDRLFGDQSRSGSHRQTPSGQLETQATVHDRLFGDQSRSGSHRQTPSAEAPQPSPMATTTVPGRLASYQARFGSHSQASINQAPMVGVRPSGVRPSGDRAALGNHHQTTTSQRQLRSVEPDARAVTAISHPAAPPVTLAQPDGKAVRMPRNAVRVLPSAGNEAELLLVMRSLGGRSARSPRSAADDAVTDLERLCRSMRLNDDGLLEGADRHDTPARLKTRLDALNASGGVAPVTPTAAAASERPVRRAATTEPENYAYTATTRQLPPQPPQRYGGRQHQQQAAQSGGAGLLQPGERETGPEVIL